MPVFQGKSALSRDWLQWQVHDLIWILLDHQAPANNHILWPSLGQCSQCFSCHYILPANWILAWSIWIKEGYIFLLFGCWNKASTWDDVSQVFNCCWVWCIKIYCAMVNRLSVHYCKVVQVLDYFLLLESWSGKWLISVYPWCFILHWW